MSDALVPSAPPRMILASLARGIAILGLLTLSPLAAQALEIMRFSNECAGNNAASCVIVAEGVIDAQAGERFERFLREEWPEGARVLLSSPGGSLAGGLALGRAIRAAQYQTEVGRWVYHEGGFSGEVDTRAHCESACAYAFLGGTVRRVDGEARLGFHQFSMDPALLPAQVSGAAVAGAMADTQIIAAEIVLFLVELDIDPRVFVVGADTVPSEMARPDRAERLRLGLVTPSGFGAFFMEPFRNGVVAASRRQEPSQLYDTLEQVTALCRDGSPRLRLDGAGDLEHLSDALVTVDGGAHVALPRSSLDPRAGGVELLLTAALHDALLRAGRVDIEVGRGMASGGPLSATLDLSDMDRAMLSAAFRFCI